MQAENRKSVNKWRTQARGYKTGDVGTLQLIQIPAGLKSKTKFPGPYKIVKLKPKIRYGIQSRKSRETHHYHHNSQSYDYVVRTNLKKN
ncbi:hypothetical protein TNIN_208391 [Trichonephila inaurata madagascariensis]|uniref:Uncharacterized protein n=1 Tax=Trichonephila inaurata madagascariensis TaxID=2747483 RepID=A0A8X6WYX6_9ARAC|nr:hypothetical protein TNIN_208391 [Trichonephila inaurata madagascariensis]